MNSVYTLTVIPEELHENVDVSDDDCHCRCFAYFQSRPKRSASTPADQKSQVAMPSKQPSTLPSAVQASSRLVGFTLSVSVKPGSSDEGGFDGQNTPLPVFRPKARTKGGGARSGEDWKTGSHRLRKQPRVKRPCGLDDLAVGKLVPSPVHLAGGHVQRAGHVKHVSVCDDGAGGVGGHVQCTGRGKHAVVVCDSYEGAGGAGEGVGGHAQCTGLGKHAVFAVGVCDDGAGARGGGDGDEVAGGAGGGVGGHAQCTGLGKHAVGICDDGAQEKVDCAFRCETSYCVRASEREDKREGGHHFAVDLGGSTAAPAPHPPLADTPAPAC